MHKIYRHLPRTDRDRWFPHPSPVRNISFGFPTPHPEYRGLRSSSPVHKISGHILCKPAFADLLYRAQHLQTLPNANSREPFSALVSCAQHLNPTVPLRLEATSSPLTFDKFSRNHTFVSNKRMSELGGTTFLSAGLAEVAVSQADTHVATRDALLTAAERLFSLNGVEGTSVRQIIKEAGVNLGAINYHFGTKERLALEVFARRMEPVNRERIRRLDALEAAANGRSLELEEIIGALIRPAVESEAQGAPGCDDFMRLFSRCFQEPNPELKKFVEKQFAEVVRRFDSAILAAVPGLRQEELFWRMSFLFGALHHGQERWLRFDQMPQLPGQEAVKPDREGFIQRIISFAAAGLSAPMPKGS